MNWNIEIERTYSITGNVTAVGELELELSIDTANFTFLNDSFKHARCHVTCTVVFVFDEIHFSFECYLC